MSDLPRAMDPTRNQPPVALRIVRPYPDEDALLAAESNAFTRTGVVLLGSPSKPSGVVLRFEMCLKDGTPVMRGEGRVVGYRPADEGGESALMLRFTKLDVKSKDLLDRAVALREERRSLVPVPPPAPVQVSSVPPPPRVPDLTAPAPPPEPSQPAPSPVASAPPPTDREPERTDEPAAGSVDEPTRDSLTDVESSMDSAMDVSDLDLRSADESDLTEQAPPVALSPAFAARERPPQPQKSPENPPENPPEKAPEKPRVRADVLARALERSTDEFKTSLDPAQRNSALERLRARKPS